jgi:hypothetical protein
MKVGDNPPEGAIIDYYLPAPASGSVTLTISTPSGEVIREYSNVPPPPDATMANVPDYWLAPPVVLPTTAGMHRVAWDLRYPDPPALNFGYSGNLLDYREYTLSWHALPGLTPRSTLLGPMVLPGSYLATLTVNGATSAQPITVVRDPRVPVTDAALALQFKLQQQMVAGITATYHAFNYLRQLRTDAAHAADAAPDGASSSAIGTAVKSLDAALEVLQSGPNGVGVAHRDLGRRLNDMLVGDFEPTASVIAGVDRPCGAIDAALDGLRTLQTTNVAELNGLLKKAALPPLPSWTPPAAPACGRR